MTEETKQNNPEENKEAISIAKRNLRLFKRIALGKNKPPMFLRVLCWVNMGWSTLMLLYHLFIGVVMSVSAFKLSNFDDEIDAIGGKYFFTYALLHAIAIFGVILMWRLKKTGFYIFTGATALMPFLYSIMAKQLNIELTLLLFSAAAIGLFAINWKLFDRSESQ